MTCIVALEHAGAVWMGADSYVGGGNTVDSLREPKVYRSGAALLGHAGSYRRWCVLRAARLKLGAGTWTERRVTLEVVPQMIGALNAQGLRWLVDGGDERESGDTVLAIGGKVFEVCSKMSVSRSRYGYSVIGSGSASALGSLASTAGMEPRKRVLLALEVAERHTPTVRRPWKILKGK